MENGIERKLKITPEQVVGAFNARGRENKGALELLEQWMNQEQVRRDNGEITEVDLWLGRAKILRDAGFVQEAIDCFVDLENQAFLEYNDLLLDECQLELTKLRAKL